MTGSKTGCNRLTQKIKKKHFGHLGRLGADYQSLAGACSLQPVHRATKEHRKKPTDQKKKKKVQNRVGGRQWLLEQEYKYLEADQNHIKRSISSHLVAVWDTKHLFCSANLLDGQNAKHMRRIEASQADGQDAGPRGIAGATLANHLAKMAAAACALSNRGMMMAARRVPQTEQRAERKYVKQGTHHNQDQDRMQMEIGAHAF